MQAKKLIEVAMPIKEISAESVRDKSIRHGHISTLHLWWARRPLPVSRAVVFASLVPDPLDENCSPIFRDAVDIILGKTNNLGDPYQPYQDIPWTSVFDPMEDNLRNRLLMFVGKYSDEMQSHLLKNFSKPHVSKQLNNSCLIKWENKNNEEVLNKARKLIYVAHNCTKKSTSAIELITECENQINNIKKAEIDLFSTIDRHISTESTDLLNKKLNENISLFLSKMPKVFDPFAGGGAIPLEASRLGCETYGNDINPVAHIIQKGSLEYPQKFGKKAVLSKKEFLKKYNENLWNSQPIENLKVINGEAVAVTIENILSFDVKYFADEILNLTDKDIGKYYPSDKNGNKPIAYYWAKVGTCINPSCKAEIPLLKQFYLCNNTKKKIHLKPIINGKNIEFEIKNGEINIPGWLDRGNMYCPICGNTTDVKKLKSQFVNGTTSEKILAVIWDSKNGKEYRQPTETELAAFGSTPIIEDIPKEKMPVEYTQAMPSCTWGISTWGQMFSNRQLNAILALVNNLNKIKLKLFENTDNNNHEYYKAVITYIAIWIDRIAIVNTNLGRWHNGKESIEHPYSKQAIPMVFDYPESNMLCNSTGSAGNQLEWIIRYIESESYSPFGSTCINASSGDKEQFDKKYLTAVVTDPPYYDAIAYADLSDFFYVWLKRTVGDLYPLNFSTPQTPKEEECTALKHHRNNKKEDAKNHFENKLTQIFDSIESQTSDIVSIMFAHQTTEAWTTLCNSILYAKMNITGSWPIDTEMANRSLGLAGAVLESSVTVSAKPSQRIGFAAFKAVKIAIENAIENEVNQLYKLGFRGSDLLTACFGKAVAEFGKYEFVEKADGSIVTVGELLEMTRELAFNSLLKGFNGDDYTKFYIGWLQLFGFTPNEHNTAMRIVQIGLSISINDLYKENILVQKNHESILANYEERINLNKNIGDKPNSTLIDKVHKAMWLYKSPNRSTLLNYISKNAVEMDSSFWRVLSSLCEILPSDIDDYIQANGLLTNRESLIKESQTLNNIVTQQGQLEF
jgi:putative DNA methylase